MRNKIWVGGVLAVSMLVYTCTVSRQADESPKRMFNPKPSPEYLSPEQSLKTFNLPKGYHLELVASEPMIKEPVAIAWDGNAKMYVAEMLTYMQDAEASGEQVPRSRISLLEDTNNDGKMDKSTVFIDNLLLPRMILCVNHELLVNETNTITITAYKDTNGDGKADEKRIVYENPKFSTTRNMEHQRSGLDWNLDNWIYMTYEPIRFRFTDGVLKADPIVSGSAGQWGLTHDNYGRLFYSAAGSEIPIYRFQINPVYGSLDFKDQYDDEFAAVWPIISTPDVQGGLPRLRPDSTLNRFTGCSGQSIYRGDMLPEDLVGDYILCEPVGRIIRRAKLINAKGKMIAKNAYYRQEFIASSDMNFRPVNSYTGPDGFLYIVDMHRGIIQQLDELKSDTSYGVRTQLLLSLSYSNTDKAKKITKDLLTANQGNQMLAGVVTALERTQNIKTYGSKLGLLSAQNRNLVMKGATIYRSLCSSCHGADARGLSTAIAPPLLGSKRLAGDKNTAIRILLHGLKGPVDGKTYPGDLMPSMGENNDEWIASVLSYTRFEFGRIPARGPSPFITPEEVRKIREESVERSNPWTIEELEKTEALNSNSK